MSLNRSGRMSDVCLVSRHNVVCFRLSHSFSPSLQSLTLSLPHSLTHSLTLSLSHLLLIYLRSLSLSLSLSLCALLFVFCRLSVVVVVDCRLMFVCRSLSLPPSLPPSLPRSLTQSAHSVTTRAHLPQILIHSLARSLGHSRTY